MADTIDLPQDDVRILRELGEWKARKAESAENREKIAAWKAHDAGTPGARVMVLAETWYTEDGVHPVTDSDLRCKHEWGRWIERGLRQLQYEIEVLRDDHFALPWIEYSPNVWASDFGVPLGIHRSAHGATAFNITDAQLTTLSDAELARLRARTFHHDPAAEARDRATLEKVFGGILGVRRRNNGWQMHAPITSTCIFLTGLDHFMTLMYDNPEGLHRLMAFLRDDQLSRLRYFEENGLLELNNEADYTGSGCMGTSDRLPAKDYAGNARFKDMWGFIEAQEAVGISPEQYGEFVWPYLRELALKFGQVYYGCCEPVDPVWEYVGALPNLARVSVSPWADEEKMGRCCRDRGVVYSRKPSPNYYIGEKLDEAGMRASLEKTVACTEGCRMEFIQRDVMTTRGDLGRFVRWVELAREIGVTHKG